MTDILKRPSAWLPVALALIIMTMWAFQIAMFGPPVRHADEGTAAHLFQIWLALEVVIVAFSATTNLLQSRKSALLILAVQIAAIAAACAPVMYFNL